MRQRLQARQAEKAAGALDGVDEPEDVAQDRPVAGLTLEADELHVDNVEMLAGFGQKLAQQIVHLDSNPTPRNANGLRGEFRPDGFMIG
jgi:hypothetical protein